MQPSDGGAIFTDVRLQAMFSGSKGVLIVPKVGSIVLCGSIQNSPATMFIALQSSFDSIQITGENGLNIEVGTDNKVRIDAPEIVLNGGEYGGLTKTPALNVELTKVKTFLDTFRTVVNGWIPVPNDGGLALKSALTAALNSLETGTFDVALQDTKVKH